MPGHAQAAISAYPELGCHKAAVPVATTWGVFDEIYCPTEQTFTFLKEVLEEVIDLFPGKYIHIGGDEAPKKNWKACQHCQQLIAKHQLGDENGLQSWFIKQIEAYVNSKGRSIIGWDEILEGGLAPNATVMSWRGMEGGVEAARSGHDVIMTPTSHAYFDYYQSAHPDEPLAIGGFLPLKKVYSFNPIPEELNPEEARHILGGQGNIWTEYMPTTEQVEYMAFPRMLAMAEVLWNGPRDDPDNSFVGFAKRVAQFEKRLGYLDINANKTALYRINSEVVRDLSGVRLKLSTLLPDQPIRYRVNMGPELAYSEPILLDGTMVIRSFVAENGRPKSRINSDSVTIHKGIRASLTLNKAPHPSYDAGGVGALHNGRFGNDHRFGDSEWLGFWGEDIDIEIALDQAEKIREVRTRFYHAPGQWVYAPKQAVLTAEFSDGSLHSTTASFQPKGNGPVSFFFDLSSFKSKLNDQV
jgi:hexosaminidase